MPLSGGEPPAAGSPASHPAALTAGPGRVSGGVGAPPTRSKGAVPCGVPWVPGDPWVPTDPAVQLQPGQRQQRGCRGMLRGASPARGSPCAAGSCRGPAVPCTGCHCPGMLRGWCKLVAGSAGAGCLHPAAQSSHCAGAGCAWPRGAHEQGLGSAAAAAAKGSGAGAAPCHGTASGPAMCRKAGGRCSDCRCPVPCLHPIPVPPGCVAAPRRHHQPAPACKDQLVKELWGLARPGELGTPPAALAPALLPTRATAGGALPAAPVLLGLGTPIPGGAPH